MAIKVDYMVGHFDPTPEQQAAGFVHSVKASEVVKNVYGLEEIAEEIAQSSTFDEGEVLGLLKTYTKKVMNHLRAGDAVQMGLNGKNVMVTLRADVKGSISDTEVLAKTTEAHAKDPSVPIRNRAEFSDLTANMLDISVQATIGKNFNKWFKDNVSVRRVKAGTTVVEEEESTNTGGGNNGGGNSNSEEIG